jgi:hypothetical protein
MRNRFAMTGPTSARSASWHGFRTITCTRGQGYLHPGARENRASSKIKGPISGLTVNVFSEKPRPRGASLP